MGTNTNQVDNDKDVDLEAAFEAGYGDDSAFVVDKEADHKTPSADGQEVNQDQVEDGDPQLNQNDGEQGAAEQDPATNEWEGVSDAIRERFETMASELKRVTNIANSASGRASKLQSELQQNLAKPKAVPKPTAQQIHEAIANKEKRDALREDWPDFAAAFDEIDSTVSSAVGAQIDSLRNELDNTRQSYSDKLVKYVLDMKHPGWENTVVKEDFKDWVYAEGPTKDERAEYENMLGYAQSLNNNSPSEAAALFQRANNLYGTLLDKYPTWATERGKLYGDPSGDAAILLLDKHKAASTKAPQQQQKQEQQHQDEPESYKTADPYASQQASNKRRLEANIAPTNGANGPIIKETGETPESLFEKAFYN